MRADLVFAVVADVVHAHENGQKLPVLLKVQTLQEGGDGRGPQRHFQEVPSVGFEASKGNIQLFLPFKAKVT